MMLSAEPPDPERHAIIVMMRIRSGMSADLAGQPDEITVFEPPLHGKMGPIFFCVPLTPMGLSRIGCQVQLSHDLHSRSGQYSQSEPSRPDHETPIELAQSKAINHFAELTAEPSTGSAADISKASYPRPRCPHLFHRHCQVIEDRL